MYKRIRYDYGKMTEHDSEERCLQYYINTWIHTMYMLSGGAMVPMLWYRRSVRVRVKVRAIKGSGSGYGRVGYSMRGICTFCSM